MRADAATEAAVIAVLNKGMNAYGGRDLKGMLALFAPDPDLVVYGMGADEKRIGLDEFKVQLERDWAQSEALSMEFFWTSVSAAGSVAWAAVDAVGRVTVDGQEMTIPARITVVLERRQGQWLIVQWHASTPMSGLEEGQSFPTSIDAVAAAVESERPDLRPHAAPDGTVTLLFTDIEGSTPLTERLGDRRWLEVLRAHNELVREHVAAHGGYEVKSQGDGFMVAFGSARRAVQCATAIQEAFASYNEKAKEPLLVRIGLHTGEAMREADDFFGKHVVQAARIAGEARGGEILVSSLLRELTESAGDITFGEGQEVELKGLSGKYHVHEVRWREES